MLWDEINKNEDFKKQYENICQECVLSPKSVLLEAGKISEKLYLIKEGCIRLWFNQDGKDITVQFFFEGQPVASVESFMQGTPSMFTIETIEPTTVWVCDKTDFFRLLEETPRWKDQLQKLLIDRLINYTHLFLSRIKDTPQTRYENMIKEHPEIIQRIPQHYIASYLGITSVSLSRIRNRR